MKSNNCDNHSQKTVDRKESLLCLHVILIFKNRIYIRYHWLALVRRTESRNLSQCEGNNIQYPIFETVTFRGFQRMSQSENRNVSDRTPHFGTLKSH